MRHKLWCAALTLPQLAPLHRAPVLRNLPNMIIRIVAISLALLSSSVMGSEYKIDLKLNDLKLSKFEYVPAVNERERINFRYRDEVKSYFVHVPKSTPKEMPVVVALHGAGRSGSSMVDAWRKCSDKHGFMVVAPNGVGNNWDVAIDDSGFINEATKDALNKFGKSSKKIYLFGHSNGARKAISLAALYPNEYTAIAVHAGTLPELTKSAINHQASALPRVGIFLGDRDHIFSVESARETTAWLEKYGYPTSLIIMQNHSHWYYEDFDRINASVWAFMSRI